MGKVIFAVITLVITIVLGIVFIVRGYNDPYLPIQAAEALAHVGDKVEMH